MIIGDGRRRSTRKARKKHLKTGDVFAFRQDFSPKLWRKMLYFRPDFFI
jgi:hypothetical protein